MLTAIIDYGSGNLRSAAKAFERAAADHGLAMETLVTDAPERVAAADRIVLPGVGAFGMDRVRLLEINEEFVAAFRYMRNRISVFTALPVASLDKAALGTNLREIGRSEGATSPRPDVA